MLRLLHNKALTRVKLQFMVINVLVCINLLIVVYIDIDECILNISMCQPDSYCDNTIGSYLCICNVGYSGDGFINCTSKSTEDVSATTMHDLL